MDKISEILASEKRLASIFKFSERKCRDFFKAARIKPNRYDLIDCIGIYVQQNGGADEKSKLIQSDRKLKEYKLDIMQGNYIKKEDVATFIQDMCSRFKSKINSIPTRLAKDIIGNTNEREIEALLQENLNEALEELSEYKYQEGEK